MKKETEGLLIATQEQAIRTKYIKKVIDKEDIDPKCRMCGERDETVAHILAECKMLAQCQYKNWRHDNVAQALHWEICKNYGLPASEKWYDHRIETVMENEEVTVTWDMKIQTDKRLNTVDLTSSSDVIKSGNVTLWTSLAHLIQGYKIRRGIRLKSTKI